MLFGSISNFLNTLVSASKAHQQDKM